MFRKVIAIVALTALATGCSNTVQPTGSASTAPPTSAAASSSAPGPAVSTAPATAPADSGSEAAASEQANPGDIKQDPAHGEASAASASAAPTSQATAPQDAQSPPGRAVDYAGLYKPVVDAYIALEQSGYTSYDESILGDDVCLTPNSDGSYFIQDTKPTLMYTLYDLNDDGTPELLIGADLGGDNEGDNGSNVFVTGIYGLRNGKPVSLIQAGRWSRFVFCTGSSGNCVIEEISGTHVDYVAEYFYKIDKNETLVTLDKLYTYGSSNGPGGVDDMTYSHTKDVNGKEVSITEQEYFSLMQKYGSAGMLDTAGNQKADEIPINTWKSLTAYQ